MRGIVVTGGGGQLGQVLSVVYKQLARERGWALPLVTLSRQQLDVTQPEHIEAALKQYQPQVVINAAAYTRVDEAQRQPERAYAVNSQAPLDLARACARAGVRLIHLSTDYVFDGQRTTPYTEADRPNPQSVYGQSKWLGEQHVLAHHPDALVVRTGWLYSDYGQNFKTAILERARALDRVRAQAQALIQEGALERAPHSPIPSVLSVEKAQSDATQPFEPPVIRIVHDQVGSPTLAQNLAVFLLNVAHSPTWPSARLLHFSDGVVLSRYEWAQRLLEVARQSNPLLSQLRCEPIRTADYATHRAKSSATDSGAPSAVASAISGTTDPSVAYHSVSTPILEPHSSASSPGAPSVTASSSDATATASPLAPRPMFSALDSTLARGIWLMSKP